MSVNKVILVGRLGQDPELKYTPSGAPVANFTIATNESWTDKASGQKQERTEWHRVVVWGKLAELCNQYLKKGRQAYLEGSLQTRQWEDQSGQKRYTTEVRAQTVQFLGGANQESGYQNDSNYGASQSSGQYGGGAGLTSSDSSYEGDTRQAASGAEPSFTEDDIPF